MPQVEFKSTTSVIEEVYALESAAAEIVITVKYTIKGPRGVPRVTPEITFRSRDSVPEMCTEVLCLVT
jgi:hypothetical protein